MSLTTDPNDPGLSHYTGPEEPGPQAEKYLVLSDEELAKDFVRPVRDTYQHGGRKACAKPSNTPALVGMQCTLPPNHPGKCDRWETAADLAKGCGGVTRMGQKLAETYAAKPKFYGATYCVHCSAHFPVKEFIWTRDGSVVGS